MSRYRSPVRTLALLAACIVPLVGATPLPDSTGAEPAADRDDPPRILILGSEHMAQTEREIPDSAVAPIVESLRRYRPDMVVVEYLPPEWPKGKGRDYRPGFDLDEYVREWETSTDGLEGRIDAAVAAGDACRAARLFFLKRDQVNAAYRWTAADCAAERDSAIGSMVDHLAEHEMGRIAFPVARSAGVERIVSFDYQGDDARWFMSPDYLKGLAEQGGPDVKAQVDSLMAAVKAFRGREAEFEKTHGLAATFRRRNSDFWLDAQEQLYEEAMPRLSYENAGRRQTDNYWLRNREMFSNIEEAVQRRDDVERILVVVGAGHKYFLDELARKAGWRWVDPLDYLPEGPGG
ncbi:MAG: DUF5694 domain-containing protein [Candidatus Palauibacterales bacterium]|nr:DUF5694 domain-containing protein [Candidatus Palauibacterales bacterium]